ncbi:MAG: CinA family protein [Pseudomonadota bacterium]
MNFSQELLDQAQKLVDLAVKSNIKIVSAESCTGGLISSLITEISGSSKIFERGFVVYSNLAKEQNLGVDAKILNQFGAVSEQVAKEMAIGALKNSAANLSIAATGIAGEKSDDTQKPVGLVYISSFNNLNQKLIIKKFNFSGNRAENRILTVQNALTILMSQIND